MATKLRLIDGSMPRLPETRKVHVRKDGDVCRTTEERYVAKFFLQNNCDIEEQLLLDQKIILDALKNDYPEIYKEKYEGKTFDFLVNFIAPNPKYDPNQGDNFFHGYNLNCRCKTFYCRNSELLEQLVEKRFSLNEYWYHTKIYEGLKDENGDCRDDAARHIDKALADIGKTPKEFFDYPLAGIPWKYEQQFLAPKKKEKKEEKQEAPQKELTREELLEQDRLFLAEQDRREEERVAQMRKRQAKAKANKPYQLNKKTIKEESSNQEEQEEFDYSSLSDTFLTECVDDMPEEYDLASEYEDDIPEEEDEVYEYDVPEEYDLTAAEYEEDIPEDEDDSEDVVQETMTTQDPEKVTASLEVITEREQGLQHDSDVNEEDAQYTTQSTSTEEIEAVEVIPHNAIQEATTTQFIEQPRTILRTAYGGAYFNFNPDFVGYGDQSSFKPAAPEQEPEEVSHHDPDVNKAEETDVTFEVITEHEQVLHHDPGVNEEDIVFEIVTESSCIEEYVWNRNIIEDDAERLLTTDSTGVESSYEVVSEFEIEPIIIPPKLPEPIATNAIVPFRRTTSEMLGSKVTRPQRMDICKTVSFDKALKRRKIGDVLLKIPIKSACFKRKTAKILLLKSKIPKIPIKPGSFRANYPKTFPKPLRLSRKRFNLRSDTNSLYSSFHSRKGILRMECVIEKQLHHPSNNLRCISKEAKNRIPILC